MHYIIGLLLVVAGIVLVIKSEWFLVNFGRIEWADEHLGGNGGSRLMYKLIGIGAVFFGFLFITNMFNGFLEGTLGRIFTP